MEIAYIRPTQAREVLTSCMQAGIVPFLRGMPGCGKSEIIRQIADHFPLKGKYLEMEKEQAKKEGRQPKSHWRLKVIACHLSVFEPTDLNGFPNFKTTSDGREVANFTPFEMFPIKGTPVPEGYDGWALFFDELNSANLEVQKACYRIILDRYVGQYELDEKCITIAAGNRDEDRAIVNELSSALISRMANYFMEPDFQSWMDEVALPRRYNAWITAFLNFNKEFLCDFDPDTAAGGIPYSCPRTWDMVARIFEVEDKPLNTLSLRRKLSGIISPAASESLCDFIDCRDKITTFDEIIKDPLHAKVPDEDNFKWATIAGIISNVSRKDQMDPIASYIERFNDDSLMYLFIQSVKNIHDDFVCTEKIKLICLEMSRKLKALKAA